MKHRRPPYVRLRPRRQNVAARFCQAGDRSQVLPGRRSKPAFELAGSRGPRYPDRTIWNTASLGVADRIGDTHGQGGRIRAGRGRGSAAHQRSGPRPAGANIVDGALALAQRLDPPLPPAAHHKPAELLALARAGGVDRRPGTNAGGRPPRRGVSVMVWLRSMVPGLGGEFGRGARDPSRPHHVSRHLPTRDADGVEPFGHHAAVSPPFGRRAPCLPGSGRRKATTGTDRNKANALHRRHPRRARIGAGWDAEDG